MEKIRWRHYKKKVRSIFALGIALLIGFLIILPFVWMVSTSFCDMGDAYRLPPRLIPEEIHLRNYMEIFESNVPFMSLFLNSCKITFIVLLIQLPSCALAGYAFARLQFPFKNALFFLVLGSMMVPAQVTVIPAYVIMNRLRLVDTHASIVCLSVTSAFGIFLLRQFFKTVPKEIEESAKIDGASNFRIFSSVMLPQSGASIATLGILTFNGVWNDYFKPLMFLNTWEKMTLPLGISALKGFMASGNPAVVMAAVSLSVLPVFLFFLFGQRYFIDGMTLGAVKG